MKKFIFFIVLSCTVSSCNSFKEKIKQEIIDELNELNELNESEEVKKGNGYHFYNEQIYLNELGYYIHHSTLDCPVIVGGVQRDYDYTYDATKNLFCPKCMNDALIDHFNKRHLPEKKK